MTTFDAVSADCFAEDFEADQGRFYEIAQRDRDDIVLAGSNTIIAAPRSEPDRDDAPAPRLETRGGPVLAVIDSRGRFKAWDWLRQQPPRREVVTIGSDATGAEVRERWRKRGLRTFFTRASRVVRR